MDEDEEIKLMVISYHRYTNDEKNNFWSKHSGKLLSELPKKSDTEMSLISKLVCVYENASQEEKDILWFLYKDRAQLYCDREKWRVKFRKREEYKSNLKTLCPGADHDFYEYIVNRRFP